MTTKNTDTTPIQILDTTLRDGEQSPGAAMTHEEKLQIAELLDGYRAAGYRRIVALRGDMPSGMATAGDFRYAAELVSFIREHCGDRAMASHWRVTRRSARCSRIDRRSRRARTDARFHVRAGCVRH